MRSRAIDRSSLRRSSLNLDDIILDPGTTVISLLENTTAQRSDIQPIKQHEDLLRLIGAQRRYPGAVWSRRTESLPGDPVPFNPFGILGIDRVGFASPERGQFNNSEGVYIDDIIIGFAERGETVTSATVPIGGIPTFLPNPNAGTNQVEHWRVPAGNPQGNSVPGRWRQLESRRRGAIVQHERPLYAANHDCAPPSDEIADGQQFRITDGIHEVRYEYDDLSLLPDPSQPQATGPGVKGVSQGTVAIGFNPLISEPDYVIAARIRDAINGPETQAVLNVMADTSDGFLAGTRTVTSTSNLVNLMGPVNTELH